MERITNISILCHFQLAQADVIHSSSAICDNIDKEAQMQKVIFLRKAHYTNGVLDSNEMLAVFLNNENKKESSFSLEAELQSIKGSDGFKVIFISTPFDDVYFPISHGNTRVKIIHSTFDCTVRADLK